MCDKKALVIILVCISGCLKNYFIAHILVLCIFQGSQKKSFLLFTAHILSSQLFLSSLCYKGKIALKPMKCWSLTQCSCQWRDEDTYILVVWYLHFSSSPLKSYNPSRTLPCPRLEPHPFLDPLVVYIITFHNLVFC